MPSMSHQRSPLAKFRADDDDNNGFIISQTVHETDLLDSIAASAYILRQQPRRARWQTEARLRLNIQRRFDMVLKYRCYIIYFHLILMQDVIEARRHYKNACRHD